MSSDISRALASIDQASCARVSASGLKLGSLSARLASVIAASGARRSCEIDASRVFRRLSVSTATRAAAASSARCCALDRERNLAGKGLEQMALFGEQQAAALGGLNGEDSECLVRARERQILGDGGGERVGAETRPDGRDRRPIERPRDRRPPAIPASATLELMQAALGIGQQHGGAARETSRQRA